MPDQSFPGSRRVIAPNPSPMTERGTNTWIVGTGEVAVIDPGPDIEVHLNAILAALDPAERIGAIIVTHAHLDHSALAPALARASGAPVYAFGDAQAGRNVALAGLTDLGGGEGCDAGFRPDRILADGALLTGPDWQLQALHTPGHFGNHICLRWGDHLFSGDHVMGWASTMVSPPDGCMTAYMRSLARLSGLGLRAILPGHGDIIGDGPARLQALTAHRQSREAEILAALAAAPQTPVEIATRLYATVPAALQGAARRNVLAHLLDLSTRGRVDVTGAHGLSGCYALR